MNLKAGNWKPQIERAVATSRYFVICISKVTLQKTGDDPQFQDYELELALSTARAQPESNFTIVPVRLEDCGRGDNRLSGYQQYDVFDDLDRALDNLAAALK